MKRTALGLSLFAFLFGFICQENLFESLRRNLFPQGEIIIEAKVDGGTFIEVYANQRFDLSNSLPIKQNKWKKYHFKKLPSVVTYLRIDPTDSPETHVTIRSITFLNGNQPPEIIDASQLRSWGLSGLHKVESNFTPNQLDFLIETNDPMIINGSLSLGKKPTYDFHMLMANLDIIVACLAVVVIASTRYEFTLALALLLGLFATLIAGTIALLFTNLNTWPIEAVNQAEESITHATA